MLRSQYGGAINQESGELVIIGSLLADNQAFRVRLAPPRPFPRRHITHPLPVGAALIPSLFVIQIYLFLVFRFENSCCSGFILTAKW